MSKIFERKKKLRKDEIKTLIWDPNLWSIIG